MKRCAAAVRRGLLAVAGNQSLFLLVAFVIYIATSMGPLGDYMTEIGLLYNYIVVPWGLALCLMRLYRAESRGDDVHAELAVLFVLVLWIIVPFALRFGVTFNNVGSWHVYTVAYFGLYASVLEESAERRGRLLGQAAALFAALSFLLGGALLYCAVTGRTLGQGTGENVFGLANGMFLSAGQHYNSTGMMCLCCMMLSLAGVERSRHWGARAACAAAAALMMVVIVLTQSRTARYAAIFGLGVGVYQWMVTAPRKGRRVLRWGAGALAAAAVMAVLYVGASALTDAALAHYARVQSASGGEVRLSLVKAAAADEGEAAQEPGYEAREAVDATFSGRTDIWRNLFGLWKENPKYLLIGYGVGNIGRRVVEGTIHEKAGAVSLHNTYLQYIADLGLIGFLLLLAFFALIARPVFRAGFAPKGEAMPGSRALLMYLAAALATGLMESRPLGGMTSMNMVLMFALALLCADGRQRRHL